MSLAKTKKQLIQLLAQSDISVIALSGKWGTGKTHLWNDVKAESKDDIVNNALYVSLFGLSRLDHVKRKIIEGAIPGVESHGGLFDGLKNMFKTGISAASAHYKALAAINDLNILLMAPVVLRKKLIVIDDIERKHEKLGIDEVLGFIDEYTQQHDSRFVIVLNDDQLSTKDDQKKLWATFREKVIDQEIKLSTTAEEAFRIAIELSPSNYSNAIKQASITCSLTNIRIIIKVIKVANQILAGHDLDEAIQARVIPSIVLFSAIHYRGMEDGPDFKFALNIGNLKRESSIKDIIESSSSEDKQDKQEESWRMLMQELGIHGCDEFEKHLVEFLESGLFEAESIKAVIDRYVAETEEMKARETAHNFLKRVSWDHRVDEVQLVTEAAALPKSAGLLDPFLATELHSVLKNLPEGEAIGEAIIDGWIAAFKESSPSNVDDENPFNNPLHPKIQNEFDGIQAKAQANETVVDACMHIIEHEAWGTLQEVALRQASAVDFETTIREMEDLGKFRRFMRQMMRMRLHRSAYESHFGTAAERFVEACRAIVNDTSSPRLASIIKRLYEGSALESELEPNSHKAGEHQKPKENTG